MKLDSKYTQVRSSILMMPELPTIAQAYQILDQEHIHQHLSKLNDSHHESLAFNVDRKASFERPKPSVLGTRPDKPKMSGNKRSGSYFCDHCKAYGHSVKRFWKIHGYPPSFKPNTWRRPNTGSAYVATVILTLILMPLFLPNSPPVNTNIS